jgi:uncharacterized membrane protein YbhN (UPF0104 family)
MAVKPLLRALAGIALFAGALWLAGPAGVVQALGRADPAWLAAGILASSGAVFAAGLRWRSLSHWLGMAVPLRLILIAQWRGMAANTVLPGAIIGGDALRTLHLQRAGHPLGVAAISVVLDRISGLWVLVVISLAISAAALALGLLPPAALPLGWAPATLLTAAALLLPLLAWNLSSSTRHRLPARLEKLLDAIHGRPRPLREYGRQLVYSAAVQTCFILAFACGGRAVGLDLPLWLFFIAAGPIFILAALPLSIGGWGTREAAAAVTFGLFGAAKELAVATAVLYGLFAVVQGLLGALTLLHSTRDPEAIRPPPPNAGEDDA